LISSETIASYEPRDRHSCDIPRSNARVSFSNQVASRTVFTLIYCYLLYFTNLQD